MRIIVGSDIDAVIEYGITGSPSYGRLKLDETKYSCKEYFLRSSKGVDEALTPALKITLEGGFRLEAAVSEVYLRRLPLPPQVPGRNRQLLGVDDLLESGLPEMGAVLHQGFVHVEDDSGYLAHWFVMRSL